MTPSGIARGVITAIAVALAAIGCGAPATPLVVCLGDSITFGTTRSVATGQGAVDPEGGYPGRLARLLEGRARVRARAVGGGTARIWLAPPGDPLAAAFWQHLRDERNDLPLAPAPTAPSLAAAVLSVDRPDVVVILLGVNDLSVEAATAGPALAVEVAARLRALRAAAAQVARVVLVSTVLPNHRDPAWLIDALNARIRADHPDFLPLGERFAAAGWEALLGDEIHPNERGYAVLAAALSTELERRAIVPAAQ